MTLRDYTRKRDFTKTSEPVPKGKPPAGGALFVIQKHAARRLHYDLRLEINGALASWAVPKGIPFALGEKHLAVHVEDHPLEYAGFEGVIPQGQYGGGTVMVWDTGSYHPRGSSEALRTGKLHFTLSGTKLQGEWTLVRTRTSDPAKENWLLMKTGGAMRPLSRRADDSSVLSGRTMQQIARAGQAGDSPHTGPALTSPRKPSARKAPLRFIAPMQPKLVQKLPNIPGWIFELKFDGYRAIALKEAARVSFYSRNEKLLDFPELANAMVRLPVERAIFDGEIVALDEQGHPSFQLLQGRDLGTHPVVCYYLFDLLQREGNDLRKHPLEERKALLATLIPANDLLLRFSANLPGTPDAVLTSVRERGLEGVVAKRADSFYESGARTGAWQKVKCVLEQEFVIGGYTRPQRTRSHFGALLVGYYEETKLRFAGKVGGGFSERLLEKLHADFQSLRTGTSPFADLPGTDREKSATWLRPERVCEVKFTEWTRDGRLRQPIFWGMRPDKSPREVVRERPSLQS